MISLTANNPAINLATRVFLRGLMDHERGLDEATVTLLGEAVERAKAISPSGWVFVLAQSLGASYEDALEAGSFAELYYAMCSFTDDVQDGDAAEYMGLRDERLLINAVAQLICVTVVRGEGFASRLHPKEGPSALSRCFLDGAVMLRGQRLELTREAWSADRYREVALLSGGRQFDVYFRVSALAAGVDPAPFLRLSSPLGLLVQVLVDRRSRDERLLSLPKPEIAAMVESARAEAEAVVAAAPAKAKPILEAMLDYAAEASRISSCQGERGSRSSQRTAPSR